MNETLIGAGILACLGVYLFISLRPKKEPGKGEKDVFTTAFLLVTFVLFLFSSFLIGKVALENKDYCETVLNTTYAINETEHGGTWHTHIEGYTYRRECFINESDSAQGLFNLTNYLIVISGIFLLLLMLWAAWQFIKEVWDEYANRKY